MNNHFTLDSYALLAWLQDEKGAAEVDKIIQAAAAGKANLSLCLINLGEIFYITHRAKGAVAAQHALAIIDTLPIKIMAADREITLRAAELKALYPIAYADAFTAALALATASQVVTGDPEFKNLTEIIEVKWLPNK